jgi:hypothetical protein
VSDTGSAHWTSSSLPMRYKNVDKQWVSFVSMMELFQVKNGKLKKQMEHGKRK